MRSPARSCPSVSRRDLILGAACAAALSPAGASAALRVPPDAMSAALPPGPFIAVALAALVCEGRLGHGDPIAPYLDGIEAFRPADGAALCVADLDPAARSTDRFLATLLVEEIAGRPLADHLHRTFFHPLAMHATRVVGSPLISAIECSHGDRIRWTQSGLAAAS